MFQGVFCQILNLYVLSNFMIAGWKRYEIFGAEHDILLLWWQYLASGKG
jgi:hypothetical protein